MLASLATDAVEMMAGSDEDLVASDCWSRAEVFIIAGHAIDSQMLKLATELHDMNISVARDIIQLSIGGNER